MPYPESSDSSKFVHPLQSVLDAMRHDPALASERRWIEDYIEKSATVMSEAEPDREDLKLHRLEQLRKEARGEIARTYLTAHLSDRDAEWLKIAIEMLKVLTGRPYDSQSEMQDKLVNAVLMGMYARLAPETLANELAETRIAEQAPESEEE